MSATEEQIRRRIRGLLYAVRGLLGAGDRSQPGPGGTA